MWSLVWKSISLVLYFDGSYTSPLTTKGTTVKPTVPFFSFCQDFQDIQLRPIASCGAAISLKDDNAFDNTLLAMGGKIFPPDGCNYTSSITSAHTEYEGLLLGLRWIVDKLEHHDDDPSQDEIRKILFPDKNDKLIIRGDCKTVITQLQGDSIPRKLFDFHSEAMELIKTIQTHLCTRNKDDDDKVIIMELIPREENKLTDAISRVASNLIRNQAKLNAEESLKNTTKITQSSSTKSKEEKNLKDVIQRYRNENKRKKHLPTFQSSPFYDAIHFMTSPKTSSAILHSDRVKYLRYLSKQANFTRDPIALAALGSAFRVEATRIPKRSPMNQHTSDDDYENSESFKNSLDWKQNKEALIIEGILLEIEAMKLFGFEKDVSLIKKKYFHRMKTMDEKYSTKYSDMAEDSTHDSFSDSYSSVLNEEELQWLRTWENVAKESLSKCELQGVYIDKLDKFKP